MLSTEIPHAHWAPIITVCVLGAVSESEQIAHLDEDLLSHRGTWQAGRSGQRRRALVGFGPLVLLVEPNEDGGSWMQQISEQHVVGEPVGRMLQEKGGVGVHLAVVQDAADSEGP